MNDNPKTPINLVFNHLLNIKSMKSEPGDFMLYVTAVKMALTKSKGCGELNKFDHVAKDLHEPGYDERYERMAEIDIFKALWANKKVVAEMAKRYEVINSDFML